MNTSKNKWLIPIAFTNIYVIWGITFLAISFGLQGFPPFILSGFRFFIAGILILVYLLIKGEKADSIANWKKNGITGILILTGGTGLVAWGEQYVTASEAAIAIATGPFWFIAIDKKNWKYYFSDKFIPIGIVMGFIGLILFLNGSISSESNHAVANGSLRITAFIVLALSSVAWVLGSLYSKKNPASHSTFMNIAQQLIIAGIISFVIAFFRNEWSSFSIIRVPLSAWLGLLFLVLFGSIIAYLSYIWLLSVKPAALVSTHTYINPIVTVIAGWMITNQAINGNQLYGLSIILIGVLLTNITKYFKLSKRSKVKVRRVIRYFNRINRPYQPI
ncbi:drug/metabolite transporter (DMT)-like permease [Chryseobacterium defluvii]|uniref:Drug/metabolite transporter (DMT)-like permease n=1 Tax=Chryseobacterium defluvii TaxID=160396 RepID=A0A840KB74_9FLAO|nr:EamA family transporter [Chryseobacterium defluvii]MBB4804850.1 drug/metabolite transporter (DMT)-like permease [Chryseobacterium defluvii]